MTEPLGPPIATGRAADVFAHGDGLVLRRYRSEHPCEYEAAVMRHVSEHGYAVPRVVEASGRDLVMERLDGTTMLVDLGKRPWRVFDHTKTLAQLLKQLHAIPAPDWLVRKHPTGDVVVHLDLHPENVMMTSRGPVVIDWSNAGRGDADVEVGDLWLISACADIPGRGVQRAIANAGRKIFVNGLLRHFDRAAIARKLPLALEQRSRDRNMSDTELARMRELVAANTR